MCIAKTKLCLCIKRLPKKLDQMDEFLNYDDKLNQWINKLPPSCIYSSEMRPGSSGPPLFVHRSLLHMTYHTVVSALHRSQLLSSAVSTRSECSELQDVSWLKVREASRAVTRISREIRFHGLENYLSTTGVTVLLSATN